MGRGEKSETLVAFNHTDNEENVMSIYSLEDDSWSELPEFPKWRPSQKGIPGDSQCVSLDGKLYVLGGVKEYGDSDEDDDKEDDDDDSDDGGEPAKKKKKMAATKNDDGGDVCSELYLLDLAGQREWEKCANMPQPRYAFGCGVLDGKIYVFGGVTSGGKSSRESFVYDPKKDAWSSIQPMKKARCNHHVVAVGDELFVHGGERHLLPFGLTSKAWLGTEVYHAGKDEWRSLEPFRVHESEMLFTAQGKLHLITPVGIYGQHIGSVGNDPWTLMHSFSFGDGSDESDENDLRGSEKFDVCSIEALNGELLALLTWSDPRESLTVLYRSKGFGSEKKEMLLDLISCEILAFHQFSHLMCPVKL